MDQKQYRLERLIQSEKLLTKRVNEDIKIKLKYLKMYLAKVGASMNEEQSDPKVLFFVKCRQTLDYALPLLDKIIDKTLCLKNYSLSPGHCRALAFAASLLGKDLTRLNFDSCGIRDEEFAAVLKAIAMHDDFKSVSFARNVFDEKSVQALKPLFSRKIPF